MVCYLLNTSEYESLSTWCLYFLEVITTDNGPIMPFSSPDDVTGVRTIKKFPHMDLLTVTELATFTAACILYDRSEYTYWINIQKTIFHNANQKLTLLLNFVCRYSPVKLFFSAYLVARIMIPRLLSYGLLVYVSKLTKHCLFIYLFYILLIFTATCKYAQVW